MNGDFEELMQEPPFGRNHGRRRSHDGSWLPLGAEEHLAFEDDLTFQNSERQSPRRKTHKPEETIIHGTRSSYVYGCKCDECRAANAQYLREWRNKT